MIMELTFEQIQLTDEDLIDVSARYASGQEIYSPTAPREPAAQFGWRDRWWLNHTSAQQVMINYWFFDSPESADTAADTGRFRLSSRTVLTMHGRDSIYRPLPDDAHGLGDAVWQAGANFLFVCGSVVVLVAEIGGQVPEETTLRIARKVSEKIHRQ